MENIMNDNEMKIIEQKIEKLWGIYSKQNNILKFQYEMLVKLYENLAKKWIYFSVAKKEQYLNSKKENEKSYILIWWNWKTKSPAFLHIILWDFWKSEKFIWFWKYIWIDKYTFNIRFSENDKNIYEKRKILEEIKKVILLPLNETNNKFNSYHNRNIQFNEIEDYFEKINSIISKFNIWKRIWKYTFINNLNDRLDFLMKNNNISNEITVIENKVLEHENSEKSIEDNYISNSFESFSEWKEKEYFHKKKERNKKLVEIAKREFERKNNWKLFCEVCNFDFNEIYWKKYIEAHHKIPLYKIEDISGNTIKDLAMLCANCHRMIHFSDPAGCLTIEELKEKIKK